MKQRFHDEASARLVRTHPSAYDRAATLVRQNGLTIKEALESVRQETLRKRAEGQRAAANPRLEFKRSFAQGVSQSADQPRTASAWDRNLRPIQLSAEESSVALAIGTPSAIVDTKPTVR